MLTLIGAPNALAFALGTQDLTKGTAAPTAPTAPTAAVPINRYLLEGFGNVSVKVCLPQT